MPNPVAYAALICWPLITLFLFSRFKTVTAIFSSILGAHLILPVQAEFDFSLIPPLDKSSIASISAVIGCLVVHKLKVRLLPQSGMEKFLVLAILVLPFITMITNQDTVITDKGFVPGLTFHDSISATINQYLRLIPFILMAQFVKSYQDLITIFKILVAAALFYSLPILFEIRMSPQLHNWIYGYFPSSEFVQQIRFGGFRPVVFIGHGLSVAAFISIAMGASVILLKEKIRLSGMNGMAITLYLLVVLFLCKTVGAFLIGVFLCMVILLMRPKAIKRISIVLMLLVMLYPLLSIFNLFPHKEMVDLAALFDADRAQSLGFRFDNEFRLLERAQQKLFLGWGEWGRNRVPGAVTDGYWIIIFGTYGVTGFMAIFGLALLSVLAGVKAASKITLDNGKYVYAGCALLVSLIMADQLPNSSIRPYLWCIIGALAGSARNAIKETSVGPRLPTDNGGKRKLSSLATPSRLDNQRTADSNAVGDY